MIVEAEVNSVPCIFSHVFVLLNILTTFVSNTKRARIGELGFESPSQEEKEERQKELRLVRGIEGRFDRGKRHDDDDEKYEKKKNDKNIPYKNILTGNGVMTGMMMMKSMKKKHDDDDE